MQFLVMEKYNAEANSFTLYIRNGSKDNIVSISPSELLANKCLKSKLSFKQIERVAYIAGLQFAHDVMHGYR